MDTRADAADGRLAKTLACGPAVLAAAVLLAGCFDLELTLKLNSDGSGTLSTRAIVSKNVIDLGDVNKPPDSKLLADSGNVHHKTQIRNGQLVQEERRDFGSLAESAASKAAGSKSSAWAPPCSGAEKSRVRWVLRTSKRPSAAPPPDPRMIEMMMGGHILIVEIDLPCTVSEARDVKLNTASITPYVSRISSTVPPCAGSCR